jgi:hypothetical protein
LEARVDFDCSVAPDAENLESVERTECIEAWDGEVLRPVAVFAESMFTAAVSSGSSLMIRLGLSSIVVIVVEAVRPRFLFSASRKGTEAGGNLLERGAP